ncbi:MAG: hypothetical protein ACE5MB_00790 [Anaerolineae bacterium]
MAPRKTLRGLHALVALGILMGTLVSPPQPRVGSAAGPIQFPRFNDWGSVLYMQGAWEPASAADRTTDATITFYNEGGVPVKEITATVTAKLTTRISLNEELRDGNGVTYPFRGTLKVMASRPLHAIAASVAEGNAVSEGYEVPSTLSFDRGMGTTVWAPLLFHQHYDHQSRLQVTVDGDNVVPTTVTYYHVTAGSNGAVALTRTYYIMPHAVNTLSLPDSLGAGLYSARLSASLPLAVVVETARGAEGQWAFAYQGTAEPGVTGYAPWVLDGAQLPGIAGTWTTGLAVMNTTGSAAQVKVSFYADNDPTPQWVDGPINLPPHGVHITYNNTSHKQGAAIVEFITGEGAAVVNIVNASLNLDAAHALTFDPVSGANIAYAVANAWDYACTATPPQICWQGYTPFINTATSDKTARIAYRPSSGPAIPVQSGSLSPGNQYNFPNSEAGVTNTLMGATGIYTAYDAAPVMNNLWMWLDGADSSAFSLEGLTRRGGALGPEESYTGLAPIVYAGGYDEPEVPTWSQLQAAIHAAYTQYLSSYPASNHLNYPLPTTSGQVASNMERLCGTGSSWGDKLCRATQAASLALYHLYNADRGGAPAEETAAYLYWSEADSRWHELYETYSGSDNTGVYLNTSLSAWQQSLYTGGYILASDRLNQRGRLSTSEIQSMLDIASYVAAKGYEDWYNLIPRAGISVTIDSVGTAYGFPGPPYRVNNWGTSANTHLLPDSAGWRTDAVRANTPAEEIAWLGYGWMMAARLGYAEIIRRLSINGVDVFMWQVYDRGHALGSVTFSDGRFYPGTTTPVRTLNDGDILGVENKYWIENHSSGDKGNDTASVPYLDASLTLSAWGRWATAGSGIPSHLNNLTAFRDLWRGSEATLYLGGDHMRALVDWYDPDNFAEYTVPSDWIKACQQVSQYVTYPSGCSGDGCVVINEQGKTGYHLLPGLLWAAWYGDQLQQPHLRDMMLGRAKLLVDAMKIRPMDPDWATCSWNPGWRNTDMKWIGHLLTLIGSYWIAEGYTITPQTYP